MLLSDSTAILSTHHRSARENQSSSHSDYHPHSYPCLRQPPLSPFPILPTHQPSPHSHPSPSAPAVHEMSDRPTLPGIASLLAFAHAGHPRSAFLSSSPASHSSSTRLQSSDPVAHALPAFVNIPPKPKAPHVHERPSSPSSRETSTQLRHQRHRRRSSSITIVDAEKRTQNYPNRAPPQPPRLQQTLHSTNASCSTFSIPAPPSFRKICHDTAQPYGNDTYSIASGQSLSSLRLGNSAASSHRIVNQTPGVHVEDELHHHQMERASLSLPRPIHRTPSRHNSPPPPQQLHATHQHHQTRKQSFTNTSGSSSHVLDNTDTHVRRRSNASISSSSSISGSASISSDFDTSLNIAPQAHIHYGGPRVPSSSTPSMISSSLERRCSQPLQTDRTWPNEEEGAELAWNSPRSMLEDQRNYDCNRRWGSQESSSHLNNSNQATCHQRFESPSQTSASPEIIPSSRLAGPIMNNIVPCPQTHRYQCVEVGCGKTFSRPSSLKIHSYSHTGQKPFKCMRCDRAFSVQSNLKRHQKVHEKRNIAVNRGILGNSAATTSMMAYESGSGNLIEEESGEEDSGNDPGINHRMEE